MGATGLASLTWNGQEFLWPGGNAPYLVQVAALNPDGTSTYMNTQPLNITSDPQTSTVTQTFDWGSIATQYGASGDKFSMNVRIQNNTSLTFDRYWFYPAAIQYPQTPLNTNNVAQYNLDSVSSVYVDYVSGVVDVVNEDVTKPLATGVWQGESPANTKWYVMLFVDPIKNPVPNPNWPVLVRPIPPGASETFTQSIRFGGPGVPAEVLAADVYERYRTTYPRIVQPAPHQPIARLSFSGAFRPTLPTNPRGWFNDPTLDVTTPQGIAKFQSDLLGAADRSIAEIQRVGAYGGIIWDIEGQQLVQSYIGDPIQAEILAPELNGVLDEFVDKFKAAGIPIGFTIRPQEFTVKIGVVNVSGTSVTWVSGAQFDPSWPTDPGGAYLAFGVNSIPIASVDSPTHLTLTADGGHASGIQYFYGNQSNIADAYTQLQAKIQYAYQRWGATLFYVDTDVRDINNTTPANVFGQLKQQYPDVFTFPEWRNTGHYAYTYPWTDSTNGVIFPDNNTLLTYPQAAGLIRVPSDEQIGNAQQDLAEAVRLGNVLLFDGWYQHPGNDVVIQIYQAAGTRGFCQQ
jgi:hypothetical protein